MWLEIFKTILSLSDRKRQIQEEKKERLVKALALMSDVVGAAIKDLQNNIYPTGSCIAMEQISNDIMKVVGDMLSKEDAQKLSNQLFLASKLELEYAMRDNPETIPALQKAQGLLTALSIIYSI